MLAVRSLHCFFGEISTHKKQQPRKKLLVNQWLNTLLYIFPRRQREYCQVFVEPHHHFVPHCKPHYSIHWTHAIPLNHTEKVWTLKYTLSPYNFFVPHCKTQGIEVWLSAHCVFQRQPLPDKHVWTSWTKQPNLSKCTHHITTNKQKSLCLSSNIRYQKS